MLLIEDKRFGRVNCKGGNTVALGILPTLLTLGSTNPHLKTGTHYPANPGKWLWFHAHNVPPTCARSTFNSSAAGQGIAKRVLRLGAAAKHPCPVFSHIQLCVQLHQLAKEAGAAGEGGTVPEIYLVFG